MRFTSRWNWNLEMLVFMEGGKPENPEKNPRSKDENQQQTQPTYDTGTGSRTRATVVEGECSHHCAILAPLDYTSRRLTVQKREISLPVTDHKPRNNKRLGIVGCDVIPGAIP